MIRLTLNLCLLLLLVSCVASKNPRPVGAESLELRLEVRSGPDPIGRITVNTGQPEPIALGEALGFAGVYFDIELRDGSHDVNTSSAELFKTPSSVLHSQHIADVILRAFATITSAIQWQRAKW
jgi:hypothetical protein